MSELITSVPAACDPHSQPADMPPDTAKSAAKFPRLPRACTTAVQPTHILRPMYRPVAWEVFTSGEKAARSPTAVQQLKILMIEDVPCTLNDARTS